MAYLGRLEDVAPLFRSERSVSRAGVLLALAPLLASGVFECARDIYGTLAPAFYGLRTSLLTMLLMALLRIKRPEALTGVPGAPRSGAILRAHAAADGVALLPQEGFAARLAEGMARRGLPPEPPP